MTGSPTGARSPASASAPAQPTAPRLIWSDDFSGPAGASPDAAKWGFDTGGNGWGNDELQSYTSRPVNAGLDGAGDLAVTARAESYAGPDGITRDYTSARLQTIDTFQFLYGRIEARIEVPSGQGLLPQFWLLGNDAYDGPDSWPASGEIDAMEVVGSDPAVVNGTLHGPWPWAPDGIGGVASSPAPLSAGFHVYGVDWSPGAVSFSLDGSVYATVRQADLPPGAAWSFAHPNFLLLDLAVGGHWPGSPTSATHFPARMLVDWVRVWQ